MYHQREPDWTHAAWAAGFSAGFSAGFTGFCATTSSTAALILSNSNVNPRAFALSGAIEPNSALAAPIAAPKVDLAAAMLPAPVPVRVSNSALRPTRPVAGSPSTNFLAAANLPLFSDCALRATRSSFWAWWIA